MVEQRDGIASQALGQVDRLVGLVEQVVEAVRARPSVPAIPTLSVIGIAEALPTGMSPSAARAARRRVARATAEAGGQAGATITNSSPAYRATMSLLRTERASTADVRRSAASPAAWPCLSLISLSRSRLTSKTDRLVPWRRDDSQWRRSWSSRALRLIRPVRLSR